MRKGLLLAFGLVLALLAGIVTCQNTVGDDDDDRSPVDDDSGGDDVDDDAADDDAADDTDDDTDDDTAVECDGDAFLGCLGDADDAFDACKDACGEPVGCTGLLCLAACEVALYQSDVACAESTHCQDMPIAALNACYGDCAAAWEECLQPSCLDIITCQDDYTACQASCGGAR
jgi:hypothetical protein